MPQPQTFDSFGWQGRDRRLALADTIAIVRDGETVDLLATDADFRRWLAAEQSWLGPVPPSEAPSLSDVHALRGAIRQLLFAAVRGEALPPEVAELLNRYSAASPSHRRLDLIQAGTPRAMHESAGDRASQVLGAIASGAIDLLGGPDRLRLRVCHAPSCGMFFLEGRSGQQWCSTSCGNRVRVARHYERSKRQAR